MASQVEIANAAIISVGGDIITSFNELTPEAIAVNAIWDQTRRTLLRANLWNFSVKRVELAQSATPPNYEYDYRYALPTDNLRLVQVYCDSDYKIERGYLVTNSTSCLIKYISDVTDVNEWTSDFSDMMSSRLAAEIAYSITKDKDIMKMMWAIADKKLEIAKWVDASEDIQDEFQFEHSLINSRYR